MISQVNMVCNLCSIPESMCGDWLLSGDGSCGVVMAVGGTDGSCGVMAAVVMADVG